MNGWQTVALTIAAALAIPATALGAGRAPEVDLARAEEISTGRCSLCHGPNGESSSSLYPRLAGQHHQYIAKQLADFKAGRRKSDTMVDMSADLTPEEMLALGVYFERKPTEPRAVEDADLAAVGRFVFHRGNEFSGVAACSSCHGEQGRGTEAMPRLAGQVPKYIERQLKSFDERERTNDNAIMHSIASRLTELEIKAVATYISTLD
ncbi:MAG: c-type cytochrome [Thauera phenolivorans]|uniref:C-type cytochrome n=1 Tax=Thauera phenolivorans TaxID=1792543 RepID=A0A7X7LUF3_9RHOO|nr:c-type cytochrome [Thauera phenolivorans]NLF53439.1 c-type cytochrome [Thauera phenolivorans]